MEDLGYGPWLRTSDQAIVERSLDIRELAPKCRSLFDAAVVSAAKAETSAFKDNASLQQCLLDLADMVERATRGEPPLERSDWREVLPAKERRLGPGWNS
jgi:hypothetical protein